MSERNNVLEAAALKLEAMAGNYMYEKAWRAAAKEIRAMKKLTDADTKLTDNSEQISSVSPIPSR